MRRKLLVLGLALVGTVGLLALQPEPAHCDWCLSEMCGTSSDCLSGCACAMPFPNPSGTCVEVSQAEDLRAAGYRVDLPNGR